jgi:hypothetical protein
MGLESKYEQPTCRSSSTGQRALGCSQGSVAVGLVFGIALCACGSDSTSANGGLSACDPFAAHAQPITLAAILGAGKDGNGIYYVVDIDKSGTNHVFVSDGDVLVRQRISGSGSGGSFDVFTIEDDDPAFTLEIDRFGGRTRMGVLENKLDEKSFVIGEQGEELTVVPVSEVETKKLRNLPGEIELEYADTLNDGRFLVVDRPRDDWSYEDFRLFLGKLANIEERTVYRVTRAKDGGSTTIEFDLDGTRATAKFPVMFDDSSMTFVPGTPTLVVGGKTEDLTRLDAKPMNGKYTCFTP